MYSRQWPKFASAFQILLAFSISAEEAVPGQSRRWSLRVDNDLFAFANNDSDYTAGLAFALAGEPAREFPLSLSGWLDRLDAATRFDALRGVATRGGDTFEFGLLLFTPHDLAASEPILDDRPYANLLYLASSTLWVDDTRGRAYQSTLTLGALGLPFAEQLHRGTHALFDNVEPEGYDHQISDGGEPTFRYAVSHYRRLCTGLLGSRPFSIRLGLGASVGYVTEANAEISFRTDADWWSSSPAAAGFADHPPIEIAPRPAHRRPKFSFEAGARLHLRAYNVFLQGQFRESALTFSSSEIEPVQLHVWAGITTHLARGFDLSYTLHRQTKELTVGRGAHDLTWASLSITRRF